MFVKYEFKAFAFRVSSVRSNPCKSLMEPIERELMVPWNDLATFQNSLPDFTLENLYFQ